MGGVVSCRGRGRPGSHWAARTGRLTSDFQPLTLDPAMGLDNRDYAYRSPSGYQATGPRTLTTKIVLLTVGVYLLQLGVPGFSELFLLPSTWYFQPWQFYRLLTYGFLHDTRGIEHIFINMLVLWMFGQEIERRYGRSEFLWIYLSAIVFAGLVWSLIEAALGRPAFVVGASGGISTIFILYAMNFPHRKVLFMFFIPMPMWVAALIAIAVDLNGAIARSGAVACSAHLAGALFGFCYFKYGWLPGRGIAGKLANLPTRRKPKLRIHSPTEDNDDSPMREQVDAILQKIQEQGQDSLTGRERRILEKASREYQRRRR